MTKERKINKDYAGTERSPYLDYIARKGNWNQEQDMREDVRANPDSLSLEDNIFYVKKEKLKHSKLYKKLLKNMKKLNDQELDVLDLVGYNGSSYAEAGKIMGISKSRVRDLIREIRRKLQ